MTVRALREYRPRLLPTWLKETITALFGLAVLIGFLIFGQAILQHQPAPLSSIAAER